MFLNNATATEECPNQIHTLLPNPDRLFSLLSGCQGVQEQRPHIRTHERDNRRRLGEL
jgi:hypothetical protein